MISRHASPASSRSPTRRLVERFAEAWNTHDLDRLRALYPKGGAKTMAQFQTTTETGYLDTRDPEVALREKKKLFDALPDVRMSVGRVYISPGGVMTFEWVLTATDTKGLRGARPTNAKIGVRAVEAPPSKPTFDWQAPSDSDLPPQRSATISCGAISRARTTSSARRRWRRS